MVISAIFDNLFGDVSSFFSKPQSGSNDGDPASDSVCFGGNVYGYFNNGIMSTIVCCIIRRSCSISANCVLLCINIFYYLPGLMYAILY